MCIAISSSTTPTSPASWCRAVSCWRSWCEWGWRRERFVYIPNFVDLDRFRPGAPIGKRFVYCGRLDSLKGVATLITRGGQGAAAGDHRRQPGRTRRGCARSPPISRPTCEFRGHLSKDALTAVIETARAIVVPSEVNENAPLSVLEAYAAGRPVIGSRIAGIPELIREDETGVLFPTGDADALAAALDAFRARCRTTARRHGRGRPAMGRARLQRRPSIATRMLELYALAGGVRA